MKKNLIFILLIMALIIVTIFNVFDRIKIEKKAKDVEITLSYSEFEELASQSEKDIEWWFNELSKFGVASVSLEEETIESLIESNYELEAKILSNLNSDIQWEKKYPKSFVDYIKDNDVDFADVVVLSKDKNIKSFILEGLSLRYPEEFYTIFEEPNSDLFAILLDGNESELLYSNYYKIFNETGKAIKEKKDLLGSSVLYYGLGFSEEKIEHIKNVNLDVNLRPSNNIRFSEKLVYAYKNEIEKYNIIPRVLIFTGKEILGYPNNSLETYNYMEDNNIIPALIETGIQLSNIPQEGLNEMVEYFDYQSVRVLPMLNWMQERFMHYNYDGAQEIENIIFRGVTERNIRLIYFRPFKYNEGKYVTDINEYKLSFDRLAKRLEIHDIKLGEFSIMDYNDESFINAIIIGLGLISIVILTSRFFVELSIFLEYILLAFGTVILIAMMYIAPNLGRQLIALSGALIISSLGSIFLIEIAKENYIDKHIFRNREILIRSILYTLMLGILALFGGLIVGGLLSHSKYLLEMEFFRGVKISEIMPLVVFIIFYILKFGYNRTREEIKIKDVFPKDVFKFLNINIKIIYLLIGSIIGMIIYIYIARSGHETIVQPSNLEMMFRNFLELKLFARPRLKEFLIAVPSTMLFIYIAYKAYKPFICLIGIPAVIMFTSVVNTFCHLRTPIYLSIIRTLISLSFGIIIGIVLIIFSDILERIYYKFRKNKIIDLAIKEEIIKK